MLLKAESDNVTTFAPKLLKWNGITVSQEFIVPNTRPRRNIPQKNVQQIIEEPDGRVLIRLNSSQEKGSSSKFSEHVKLHRSSYSMPSKSSNYDYLEVIQVEYSQKIYYKAVITEQIDEASSSIGSQTYSAMQPPTFFWINFISKPFEINEDYLRENFISMEN